MKRHLELGFVFAVLLTIIAVPVQATDVYPTGGMSRPAEPVTEFRYPGEFEPQEAVWMALPTYQYTENHSSLQLIIEMLQVLTPNVHVNLIVPTLSGESSDAMSVTTLTKGRLAGTLETALADSGLTGAEATSTNLKALNALKSILARNGINLNRVTLYQFPYADMWLRDMGPIYVVDDLGNKKIVDFKFDGWGLPEYFPPGDIEADDALATLIAADQGLEVISSDIVSEGGNRELNGLGTMIAIESTELGRNPGYTKAQLEAEYARLLGVTNLIWLPYPVVEDSAPVTGLLPGPDGKPSAYAVGVEHVDEVARFVSPSKILLAEVTKAEAKLSPIAAENRRRLEADYQALRNARDQDGNPFTIIRVPAAEIMYETITEVDLMYQWLAVMAFEDGSVFPYPEPVNMIASTGYMNYVVTNGVVLAPKYYKTGMPLNVLQKDLQVLQILRNAFPGRTVVQLDPYAINLGGGGMHCITQQEPVAG